MKSISKGMKPEYEKSTKARFLAEYKRHIEQMIQTINRAPIYLEIYHWIILSDKIGFI